MSGAPPEVLCEPVLLSAGVPHGFGQKSSEVPDSTAFPVQVHGTTVIALTEGGSSRREADAILSTSPGTSVGIVTADCVPILAASEKGQAVVAIHAGWRGLAAGVIEAGIEALRSEFPSSKLICAVGPAARGCCYEVDAPVEAGLRERYESLLPEVLLPGAEDHFQLDLPLLATRVLERSGVDPGRIGVQHRVCTICDPDRFESFRRDGPAAGRLRHFISIPATIPRQG